MMQFEQRTFIILTLVSVFMFWLPLNLAAESESFEQYRPNQEQSWKLAEYTNEIARIEDRLSKKYIQLQELGYVSENQETQVVVKTHHEQQFEQKDSTLVQETVTIQWQNRLPSQLLFRVRNAKVKALRTVITLFKMGSVRSGDSVVEPEIDFISIETLSSGRGNLIYYTFPIWNAPPTNEKTRTFVDNGISFTFPFGQIRDPAKKIEAM
ncbi:MAG: hypothetical protein H3C43_03455, partial [Leptonema sp. (in: Bacteria)]|nr:hypothetical protein [Leptonema sp. (in: bacteria)]